MPPSEWVGLAKSAMDRMDGLRYLSAPVNIDTLCLLQSRYSCCYIWPHRQERMCRLGEWDSGMTAEEQRLLHSITQLTCMVFETEGERERSTSKCPHLLVGTLQPR